MTQVYLEQDGKRYLVSCLGHATGSPAVCAAVSCLAQTLEAYLEEMLPEDSTRLVGEGQAVFRFSGPGARTVFYLMTIGFLRLEQTAPECVQVTQEII
ncbi:MAG: ribosomal-processing cysteine protease Prp [Oscillospiraceae bacterium]|nr:ribosomal-processing cysteine protease Prp [Oscillospiraceae bacterium]